MRPKATAFVLTVALLALLPPVSGIAAQQHRVHVKPGQSIQAAINAASPGTVIEVAAGLYQENLVIDRDGITLVGSGLTGANATVLEPPATPPTVCTVLRVAPPDDIEYTGPNGICVAKLSSDGSILANVHDVRVSGFTVRNFPGVGIVFAGADRIRADHNVAENNTIYGITAFRSSHGLFDHNTVSGTIDAGLYMGDSPNADFTIRDNIAHDDLWGILVRDSVGGQVTDNTLYNSCAGLVFLDSGTSKAGVADWRASDNTVTNNTNNNKKCFSEASGLPFDLDGVGIFLAGGRHIVIRDNSVRDNHPTSPIDPKRVGFAGGIVVVSSEHLSPFPGLTGSKPFDNTIAGNALRGNQPVDLAYDKLGSGNRFVSNECRTSMPAGLCDDD